MKYIYIYIHIISTFVINRHRTYVLSTFQGGVAVSEEPLAVALAPGWCPGPAPGAGRPGDAPSPGGGVAPGVPWKMMGNHGNCRGNHGFFLVVPWEQHGTSWKHGFSLP